MKQDALVTVIVPIYNTEAFLPKCIDSLLAQTHKKLEILLIDDGSPDGCGRICDEYAAKDDRITVFHQENSGQAGARNFALSVATGDYISFVDSDDWIAPDTYKVMLQSIEKNACDIAACGRFSVKDGQISESRAFKMEKETVMSTEEAIGRFLTYQGLDCSPCDKLFKRELLTGLTFPMGYICEDAPFVYRAIKRAKKIVHCAKPLYYVLIRSGSTSRSAFNKKSLGLYYNFKTVWEESTEDFPTFRPECDYLYLKNLLVLAARIAMAKGKIPDRKIINDEIRKHKKAIRQSKYLKKSYKILALAISWHIERFALKVGRLFGFKIA